MTNVRWMVPNWTKRAAAHLCNALGDTGYVRVACGAERGWNFHKHIFLDMAPDDGRPRCKRCLAVAQDVQSFTA